VIGNPLALLGLLAVAVPILIHLLGRHQSRIERFPTLRFIGTSRLNPTRRRRISDWPLLLVRMAIVALAALALSQPVLRQRPATATELTRAIILDTSASMYRLTPAGPAASLRAQQVADSLSVGVISSRVETGSPADAIEGAVAWLATRPGLREVAIVSDFQRSGFDSVSLAAIPAGIGISLAPIPVTQTTIPRTAPDLGISTFGGSGDAAGADAAWRAIGRARPPEGDGRIAIIYRAAPMADALSKSTVPIDSTWMARIVAAVEQDPTFASVGPGAIRVGRNGARLAIFVQDDAGSLASAALNQALLRAVSTAPARAESDTATWPAAELSRWQRAPQPGTTGPRTGSDGRLFWALALLLIGLEQWLRSREREAAVTELPASRERAA
jgi:hypothetical protein